MTKKQIEQIEFWKKNPDVFIEEYFNIKLFPYQKQFVKLINKTPLYLLLYPRRELYDRSLRFITSVFHEDPELIEDFENEKLL